MLILRYVDIYLPILVTNILKITRDFTRENKSRICNKFFSLEALFLRKSTLNFLRVRLHLTMSWLNGSPDTLYTMNLMNEIKRYNKHLIFFCPNVSCYLPIKLAIKTFISVVTNILNLLCYVKQRSLVLKKGITCDVTAQDSNAT